ncbi:hypothetical protein C0991_010582 [Blastosporella zonata]|nr:hypothetical protein C0991_010582 [Blastosporella zonata]
MSEGDSLSDSDWLDIASSRESDDNDSVMSGDSDSEEMGMVALSRRSSVSVSSSRDGDVDAWEGFVDDSSDEDARNPEFLVALPLSTTGMVASSMTASEATVGPTHDLVEEQRVNEALDQSMMSTLSASRSSTASAHASLRDLRLSFPDPLTSPRDELNRSYEEVPPSDVTLDTDISADDTGDADNLTAGVDTCEEDLGSFTTTPAVTEPLVEEDQVMFEVVLYGASSSIKWSFAADLIEQVAFASGLKLVEAASGGDQVIKYLQLRATIDDSPSSLVLVHDRTEDKAAVPSHQAMIKRPSLAIVYLPLTVPTPAAADHTLYLPVLVPPSSLIESHMSRSNAMRDWNAMSIPSNKVAQLGRDRTSPIIDGSDVEAIRDIRAYRLLHRLLSVAKKRPTRVLSDRLSPAQAVTLFALMSLIVGFAMNTTFRKSSTPTPTATTSHQAAPVFWGIFGPEVNHTSVIAITARANTPIITSHKESSLSIVNPGTTSLAITSDGKPPVASSSTTPPVASFHCKPSTWTDKVKSVKDTVVRQASSEVGPSTTVVPQSDGPLGASKTTSLGLVVESLSEALDARVAQIRKDYRVNEVIESLDDLARAIRRQTLRKVDSGKGKAKEIRDSVQYRHERARGRAKELKKKGEEIIYLASGEFVERTNLAKKKARDILKKKGEEIIYLTGGDFVQSTNKKARDILKKKGDDIIYLTGRDFVESTNMVKKRARDVKTKGEEIIYLASGEFVERTKLAKKKARDITLNLANSESWRTYQKIHADWVALLNEKGRDEQGLRKGRGRKGQCRKMKSNGPSSLFSRSFTDFYLV